MNALHEQGKANHLKSLTQKLGPLLGLLLIQVSWHLLIFLTYCVKSQSML